MINVNTIGHEIPEKIKSCISEWILKLSLKTIKIKKKSVLDTLLHTTPTLT